ncbi:hypothetical protein F4821DRAFT_281146 [Hypoxylon rubiginosum]|uniref:Uncharacterized protein n=1 Tax=Hypoxylon rubiginosum TaxID=110542 RepID=A0ACC0CRM7_9PEZI|nr:hypothetical protein F4821DRAFT_281146 [Hypoxylon rubiginosum]
MKSFLVFLALGVLAAAAPVKDNSNTGKRAPDADSEISEAGFVPARTNSYWSEVHDADLAAIETEKGHD